MIVQYIKYILWGKAARGIPISEIASTCHTQYPDKQVPVGQMHEVIYNAMRDIQQKLKDHQ